MKVFKFGGASVKDADGVKNTASIICKEQDPLVVVVSAMGKTTDSLVWVTRNYFDGNVFGLERSSRIGNSSSGKF